MLYEPTIGLRFHGQDILCPVLSFAGAPEDLQSRGVRAEAAVMSYTWALHLPPLLESAFVTFNSCDGFTESH